MESYNVPGFTLWEKPWSVPIPIGPAGMLRCGRAAGGAAELESPVAWLHLGDGGSQGDSLTSVVLAPEAG